MKHLLTFLLTVTAAFAHAQLRQPLLPHLGDLPAMPGSSIDAAARCYNKTTGLCGTDDVMKSFTTTHIALTNQLSAATPVANTAVPDTSFVSQVKNMTPDQQRAWAMQYAMQQQQAAAAQPSRLPSQEETNFFKTYTDLVATNFAFTDSITQQWTRMVNDLDQHLTDLAKKRDQKINQCPWINGGEGDGGPDPVCAKGVEQDYQSWIRSYYELWLQHATAFINGKKTAVQTRYAPAETLLAQTDYMSNPSMPSYRNDAVALQQMILSDELLLSAAIEQAWSKGCEVEKLVRYSKARYGESN